MASGCKLGYSNVNTADDNPFADERHASRLGFGAPAAERDINQGLIHYFVESGKTMSKPAFQEFNSAREYQLQKNEARRMRTLVEQARGNIQRSGARWPFELTQNAHDPGPRPGLGTVSLQLSFDGNTVVYEHDGKPFSMQDLAALLSGGSSKEFESTDMTGRFGTGFLLTHVLSEKITFRGVLATKTTGYEEVELSLDRSGDEEQIYANTVACNSAIEQASGLAHLDGQPTARFTYITDKPEAARIGVAAFCSTLPYLYGTCAYLGLVTVRNGGETVTFRPAPAATRQTDGGCITERKIHVSHDTGATRDLAVVRIAREDGSPSSLVAVIEQIASGWQFCEPPVSFPKLFCRFPLRASDFLPINLVLDGRFDLAQERDSILMKEADQAQIAEGLSLLPALAAFGLQEQWQLTHKLARVGMPQHAFGDTLEEPLKGWWKTQLSQTAKRLAGMPIIRTADGHLHHAAPPPPTADFIIPKFDVTSAANEIDFATLWQLTSELEDPLPPALEIAPDWTPMAQEWMDLGVTIARITLADLANFARDRAKTLGDIKAKTPKLDWLARYLNLIGQTAIQHNRAPLLANLIPNQNRALVSPGDLRRDAGIDERLKDISATIKLDVRSRLLLLDLAALCEKPQSAGLKSLIEAEVPSTLDNAAVINECILELSKQLPDEKAIPNEKSHFRAASIELFRFLWDHVGTTAASLAQQCPLVASDGTATRWTSQRKMMAPVSTWHKDAQPFAAIYKKDRILSEDYVSGGSRAIVDALVAWGMAYVQPLCTDTHKELTGDKLKAIAATGAECEGIIATNIEISQIALLPNELIQRANSDVSLAKALLGLVLCYAARHDLSWQVPKTFSARSDNADTTVTLTPALWIADLLTRAWVPARGENGTEIRLPDAGNLESLLERDWLKDNEPGLKLLTTFFGFHELELRLLVTAETDDARRQIESGLAKLVEAVGADPAKYEGIAIAVEIQNRRAKEKERNRKFGLAVQAAIEQYLHSQNIRAVIVDDGYDYDVFLDNAPSIEAGIHSFKLANYLLEVKATTSGEVRLTPKQALTAAGNPAHFVLCVVDLRGITPEQMEAEWTAADVDPRTKILTNIGLLVNQPHGLVLQATQCKIGLRNDGSLRYGVPVPVWTAGIPVCDWVQQLKPFVPANGQAAALAPTGK